MLHINHKPVTERALGWGEEAEGKIDSAHVNDNRDLSFMG